MAVRPVQIGNGHVLEKYRRVFPDLLVSGQQREIRVHLCRLLVVIPCSDLGDIADRVFAPVGDQADLGVDLVSFKSVDDTASRLFHPL